MLSDIDAISDVAAIWAAPIALADDGPTIGAIKRLKTAKIESRRGTSDQGFTGHASHIVHRKRSAGLFTFSSAHAAMTTRIL